MSGRFQPGPDRRRHKFTRAECQRGYRAALEKCSQDWDLYAWFYYKIRGYYRKEKRDAKESEGKGKRTARRAG